MCMYDQAHHDPKMARSLAAESSGNWVYVIVHDTQLEAMLFLGSSEPELVSDHQVAELTDCCVGTV